MSEVNQVPLLLLLVPSQYEVDPEALRELRRAVSDEYRAELWSGRYTSRPPRSGCT
jgi:hypothetical protein